MYLNEQAFPYLVSVFADLANSVERGRLLKIVPSAQRAHAGSIPGEQKPLGWPSYFRPSLFVRLFLLENVLRRLFSDLVI